MGCPTKRVSISSGGLPLVKEDLRKQKKLNSLLSAYRNRRIYTLWPSGAYDAWQADVEDYLPGEFHTFALY